MILDLVAGVFIGMGMMLFIALFFVWRFLQTS
jgi:hypothetical protein